ncbi:MAG: hypothetical protein V5A68_01315 [Candidatus Thermoplasmatota archaeon]
MDKKTGVFLTVALIILVSNLAVFYVTYRYQNDKIDKKIKYYKTTMKNLENEVDYLKKNISNLSENLIETDLSLQENLSEIRKLRNGSKYDLHDPTFLEAKQFIEEDKTDEIEYNNETFTCIDYVKKINDHAESKGIRCGFVSLNFNGTNTGHAILGFNTTDKGMVFFEPQNDNRVENLEVGKEYWTECVIPEPTFYYEDHPNDTIEEIMIIW